MNGMGGCSRAVVVGMLRDALYSVQKSCMCESNELQEADDDDGMVAWSDYQAVIICSSKSEGSFLLLFSNTNRQTGTD